MMQFGALQTSKIKVSYNRSSKNQEIAGPQKCHQNDLQMAPILEPLGTQDHKKSRKTGTQKNTTNLMHAKRIKKGPQKGIPRSFRKRP